MGEAKGIAQGSSGALRQIGTASLKLLAGGAIAAALSLVSFALTARALGLHEFGLLLIAVAYTQTIGRLVGFQSWHVIIRFGPELDRDELGADSFFTLVRFGFLLDVCGAIIASLAVVLIALTASEIWPEASLPPLVVALFAASVLCRVNGTAVGVMRLSDRFGALAAQAAVVATVKLVLVVFAYLVGGSLVAFAAIWATCVAIEYLAVVVQAYGQLRRRRFTLLGRAAVPKQLDLHEFWRLHISANLWTGAQSLRELDSLVVAAALSPAALAIYRAARDLALKLNRLLDPIVLAAYPYLARARVAQDDAEEKRLFWGATLTAVGGGVAALIAYLLCGRIGIGLLFGPEFAGAYEPGVIFMLAFVFTAFGRLAMPAAMARGEAQDALVVTMAAVPAFLLISFLFSLHAGVLGAALAFLAYSALTSILTVALVTRQGQT